MHLRLKFGQMPLICQRTNYNCEIGLILVHLSDVFSWINVSPIKVHSKIPTDLSGGLEQAFISSHEHFWEIFITRNCFGRGNNWPLSLALLLLFLGDWNRGTKPPTQFPEQGPQSGGPTANSWSSTASKTSGAVGDSLECSMRRAAFPHTALWGLCTYSLNMACGSLPLPTKQHNQSWCLQPSKAERIEQQGKTPGFLPNWGTSWLGEEAGSRFSYSSTLPDQTRRGLYKHSLLQDSFSQRRSSRLIPHGIILWIKFY